MIAMSSSSVLIVLSLITPAIHCRPANDVRWRQSECDCSTTEQKVMVVFERLATRKSNHRGDTLWFRLVNQTNCPIFVPTDHEYGLVSRNGRTIVGIEEGSVVFVKYQVKKFPTSKGRGRPGGEYWISYMGGTTYYTRLEKGASLLCYIPKSNLKRASYLAIPYVCQRDASFESRSPRVLFNLSTLPKEIQDRVINVK